MKEKQILDNIGAKLGIENLNQLQRGVLGVWPEGGDMVVYSPTGSGKTIAYGIPMLKSISPVPGRLQAVVIVPSRELAVQSCTVIRQMATGLKVTLCCGGHDVADERQSLAVVPDVVVATPGRLLDHATRGNVELRNVRLLVLDEFDKSLELGFDDEMSRLLKLMPNLSRRILTSATVLREYPDYLKLNNLHEVNFLDREAELSERLAQWVVRSADRDKLDTLRRLLLDLPDGKTIVFVNYRDAALRVYQYLADNRISAGVYNGALSQVEREKAVALFNNGSYCVMVTTDLGARGLDIDGVKHIVHYHLPVNEQAFTHRNGRTARVDRHGEVFVILGPDEQLPDYADISDEKTLSATPPRHEIVPAMRTLYFMAGRKEKISRGDIVGFIANNSNVAAAEIGHIDVKDHYALVAVPAAKAKETVAQLSSKKIKGKKVRISFARVES